MHIKKISKIVRATNAKQLNRARVAVAVSSGRRGPRRQWPYRGLEMEKEVNPDGEAERRDRSNHSPSAHPRAAKPSPHRTARVATTASGSRQARPFHHLASPDHAIHPRKGSGPVWSGSTSRGAPARHCLPNPTTRPNQNRALAGAAAPPRPSRPQLEAHAAQSNLLEISANPIPRARAPRSPTNPKQAAASRFPRITPGMRRAPAAAAAAAAAA